MSFWESVPELPAKGQQAKLEKPGTKKRKSEVAVKSAEPAAVLALGYRMRDRSHRKPMTPWRTEPAEFPTPLC